MGRYAKETFNINLSNENTVPLGGIIPVFRSGLNYKAVGECVLRASYAAFSTAYPRTGAYSAITNATGMPISSAWTAAAYGNGVFVMVSISSGSGTIVATSTDGLNWVQRTGIGGGWLGITFAAGLFVVVGQNTCQTSPDGVTWTARTMPTGDWASIAYGGGMFVAAAKGSANTDGASSPDGVTWTARTMPTSATWLAIAYGNGVFVAVSASTPGATSANGTSWTARTLPSGNWTGVAYGNSMFIAVNTAGHIATSPDGITWTSRLTAFALSGSTPHITFGNNVFVVSSDTGVIYTSADGTIPSWVARPSVVNGRACAYGAGTFVLAGESGGSGSTKSAAIYVENITDSEYIYLSGTPGNFVRVQ